GAPAHLDLPPEADVTKELETSPDPLQGLAGNAERTAERESHGDDHRVEALEVAPVELAAERLVALDGHAQRLDARDLLLQDLLSQHPLRDAAAPQHARLGKRLEDGPAVAPAGELIGGAEPGRP